MDDITDPEGFAPALRALLDEFAARCGPDLYRPDWVHDRAHVFSEAFASCAGERGIPAGTVSGFRFLPGTAGRVIDVGHMAVEIRSRLDGAGVWSCPVVVDWTAHQFGPAPVPQVRAPEDWRAEWRPL